jgi:esterase
MKLHFRKIGEGQPFIILHGLFGLSDNWQSIAKVLAEKYALYLVDLRNHGHSPHSNEWNYKVMAEDVAELISDEGLIKPILMGHSMGGKTAMMLTSMDCDLLSKLIVVDIGIRRYEPPSDVIQALEAVHLDTITTRKEAEEVIRFYVKEQGTVLFLLKNLYWESDTRLAWRFNLDVIRKEINNIANSVSLTGSCDLSSLFISGERSSYIMDSDRTEILNFFPKAKFEVVPDAGHWVHADNPQGFIRSVEAFLQNS